MAKTGSTSIAALFGHFRASHEFMMRESCEVVAARFAGSLSSAEMRSFLRQRDRAGRLEMDAATFHWGYAEELVREFPESKFIVTYRHWYAWLDSVLDMLMTFRRDLPAWLFEYGRLVTGVRFAADAFRSRRRAVEAVQEHLEELLEHWARVNRMLLRSLPPDRRLLIDTELIGERRCEIAALAGVPARSLRSESFHSNKALLKHCLLAECAGERLVDVGRRRCAPTLRELQVSDARELTSFRERTGLAAS